MSRPALILASHGIFAQEALNSAAMILRGKPDNVGVLSVTEGKSYEQALAEMHELYQQLDTSAGCLIFTDIYGGTPANTATYLNVEHPDGIRVFSGLNLPLLLEILLDQNSSLEQLAEKIRQLHPQSLVDVTAKLQEKENEDGDSLDSY
jgi:PTS system mannose-specific IIA component